MGSVPLSFTIYHVSSTEQHVKEEIITSLKKEIYGAGLEVLDHEDLEGKFIKEELKVNELLDIVKQNLTPFSIPKTNSSDEDE